jgi:hypothetical protein
MEIPIVDGLALHVYKSTIDGRMVVEIETTMGDEINHDDKGVPKIKVMLNEACLHD